jgi:hypothetical protein
LLELWEKVILAIGQLFEFQLANNLLSVIFNAKFVGVKLDPDFEFVFEF